MKKLLSILAVSGIIATSAPTAVACNKTSSSNALKALDTSSLSLKQGSTTPIDQIKAEIASQAKVKVTDLKGILISIVVTNSDGIVIDTNELLPGNIYNVTINVPKGNQYFASKVYTLAIQINKITLNTKDMLKDLKANDDLYGFVRDAIAKQSDKELTSGNIKLSNNILIAIWDTTTNSELKEGTKSVVGHSYDVKIMINNNDTTFNATLNTDTNKPGWVVIPVLAVGKLTLDTTHMSFKLGDDLYNNVRTYIAAQSNGLLTSEDIATGKAKDSILISIYDTTNNKEVINNGSMIAGCSYDVKIMINSDDNTFNKFDWKTISVKAIKLTLDTSHMSFKLGDNLYNNVRTYIANQSNGLLTSKDIATGTAKDSILISILDTTNNNKPVNDDSSGVDVFGHSYDVKIMITNDSTFNDTKGWTVIPVSAKKYNLHLDTLKIFGNSENPYDQIRYQISEQSRGKLTVEDIKNSKTILISIKKWQNESPLSYEVTIQILNSDPVFNTLNALNGRCVITITNI